jgi:5'-3' exonuclease
MILVDLSQVMISNLFANMAMAEKAGQNVTDDNSPDPASRKLVTKEDDKKILWSEDLIRHMVLNSLRYYKMKFQAKYGKLVICVDNKHYWRKDVFPYYKANRKRDRDSSPIDWHSVFESLNKIRTEISEFFPYHVMNVEGAEADDIIGVVAKREHTAERILILSGDKDFVQLQKYPNIDQYAPIQKVFIRSEKPAEAIREHIMLGDSGDGIPNFLSADDTFVSGKRQTPIRKEKLARWVKEPKPENFCDLKMLRGYKRNQELIDLDFIPKTVQKAIVDEWEKPFTENRKHLLDYFVKNKLVHLMDHLNEF